MTVHSETQYVPIYPSGGFRALYPVGTVTGYSSPQCSYQGDIPQFWLLRFYVPPSTSGYSTLALFCPQTKLYGVVARLGAPPQCDLPSYTASSISSGEYLSLSWDMQSVTFSKLRERDHRFRNGSGTVGIVTDDNATSTGEWLYIKVLFAGMTGCTYGCSWGTLVNGTAYASWFPTVAWDAYGNPPLNVTSIASGSCWFGPGGYAGTTLPTPPDPEPPDPEPGPTDSTKETDYLPLYPSGGYRDLFPIATVTAADEIRYFSTTQTYWLTRIWIAPAANVSFSLNIYPPSDLITGVFGVVMRLGGAPQCVLPVAYGANTVSSSYFSGLSFDEGEDGTSSQFHSVALSSLRIQDHRFKITGTTGSVWVVTSADINYSAGEWLYIIGLYNGLNNCRNSMIFVQDLDSSAYNAWYPTVAWDAYGNPPIVIDPDFLHGTCMFGIDGYYNPPDPPDPEPIVPPDPYEYPTPTPHTNPYSNEPVIWTMPK